MSATDNALATLRDPRPEEASRWYKPRRNSASARLKVLAEFLLEDETVRLVKRTDKATDLVVDTALGSSLRVSIRVEMGTIEVRLGPRLLQKEPDPRSREQYLDEISSFVEVLQVGSGFYVYSEDLIGFEPKGSCPSCGIEVYDWQDDCEVCEAKLHVLRPGEDEHDGRAQRVTDFLLRHEMIELASPRGRRNVERTISLYYAYNGANAEVLHGLLMDMADIAELYCDAKDLHRVLGRIK